MGKYIPNLLSITLLLVLSCVSQNQPENDPPYFLGLEHLFTPPKNYVVYKSFSSMEMDGSLTEESWKQAQWTDEFVDIEGSLKPVPYLSTRVKMLWDEEYLYFGAELKDPHVWATLKSHDDIIFMDNDFEIFIDVPNDGGKSDIRFSDHDMHRYYEFEMNAWNTTWDLFLDKPYRNGGRAVSLWEIKGLQTGVHVQGTINDPSDTDVGWTLEVAIPFSTIQLAGHPKYFPEEGAQYRINFSRVQYDTKIEDNHYTKAKDSLGQELPCYNWVWSPQGVINMHYPERWGYLQFSKEKAGSAFVPFVHYYSETQKKYLWLIYYRQKEWSRLHDQYINNLSALGIKNAHVNIEGKKNIITMEATSHQFKIFIQAEGDETVWSVNQDGQVTQSKRIP